jgi:very-short-patch-repair endonuclease
MPRITIQRARSLRKRQTDAEKLLWYKLRNRKLYGLKFRRQFPVGRFITDFCCLEHRLIIEVDGWIHFFQQENDRMREEFIREQGYRILRFRNSAVKESMDVVLQMIAEECFEQMPSP